MRSKQPRIYHFNLHFKTFSENIRDPCAILISFPNRSFASPRHLCLVLDRGAICPSLQSAHLCCVAEMSLARERVKIPPTSLFIDVIRNLGTRTTWKPFPDCAAQSDNGAQIARAIYIHRKI